MTIELRKKITQQIGEALGYASLCWEPKPTGVFDTTATGKAMDHAMRHIDALLDVVEAAKVMRIYCLGSDASTENMLRRFDAALAVLETTNG